MKTLVERSWLDQIDVAAPCRVSWDAMKGDERVRFCGACKLNVYNLSGMSRQEAEKLVSGADGRVCVRFFRRQDGTVLTEDCPVGLATRLKRRTLAVAGWFLAFFGIGSIAGLAFKPMCISQKPIMGAMCPPPHANPTPPADGSE
jgi:hypothetical protein